MPEDKLKAIQALKGITPGQHRSSRQAPRTHSTTTGKTKGKERSLERRTGSGIPKLPPGTLEIVYVGRTRQRVEVHRLQPPMVIVERTEFLSPKRKPS